jgi:hypothetical protein
MEERERTLEFQIMEERERTGEKAVNVEPSNGNKF